MQLIWRKMVYVIYVVNQTPLQWKNQFVRIVIKKIRNFLRIFSPVLPIIVFQNMSKDLIAEIFDAAKRKKLTNERRKELAKE